MISACGGGFRETTSLCVIAYLTVIARLLVLVHELCHVAVALALVPQDVIVRIGARPRIQLLKCGRLWALMQLWDRSAADDRASQG